MSRPPAVAVSVAVAAVLLAAAAGPMHAAGGGGRSRPDPHAEAKVKVAESINAFGLNLYGEVREKPGNFFLSPYSLASALAMTWAGARGETADEMAETLVLPEAWRSEPERIHAAFGRLTDSLNAAKAPYELSAANALWGQKGFGFRGEFLGLVGDHYGAGLREVDFAGRTEAARHAINVWVEKETREKIKNLVPRGGLTPETRLVLTNAIYFQGTWQFPFDKTDTKEEDFFAPSGPLKAPMMRETKHFRYADAGGHHVLQLSYKGRDLAMVLFVPKAKDGLPAVEASLSAQGLAERLRAMRARRVQLFLPRFKVTWKLEMSAVLARMGMPRAFHPDRADFSGMAPGLYIQKVFHKAFVDVNEEGTEAAAATAVVVGLTAMPAEPIVVRADRPFLYLIRDTRSGAILFLGRLVNPKA